MFIGLNYIDGDFLPHRPDFYISGGSFPDFTKTELEEAESACKKAAIKWKSLGFTKRRSILLNFLNSIRKNGDEFIKLLHHEIFDFYNGLNSVSLYEIGRVFEYDYKNNTESEVDFTHFVFDDIIFVNGLKEIIEILISGSTVIISPKKYRMTFQFLIECANTSDFPIGVVNLLHLKEEI